MKQPPSPRFIFSLTKTEGAPSFAARLAFVLSASRQRVGDDASKDLTVDLNHPASTDFGKDHLMNSG